MPWRARAKPESPRAVVLGRDRDSLLKAFSADESTSHQRLARRLRIAKSTARRLAVTLVSEGMPSRTAAPAKYVGSASHCSGSRAGARA